MKSTWSPGPISQSQASLSHELWKVPQGPRSTTAPSRPPPGLTNTKPSSTWGGNSLGLAQGWSGSYSSGECSFLSRELTGHYLSHKLMHHYFRLFNQPAISAAIQRMILKERKKIDTTDLHLLVYLVQINSMGNISNCINNCESQLLL